MKKISLLILFLIIGTLTKGQLAINTALAPTQMVQNFVGSGVTVSNIVYTGGTNSKGFFSNGNATNLGLNSGIVLCTGTATQIPNPATFFMSTNLNLAGDANLNSINNGCLTHDACILEFDFIPTSDTVKFKYVFGSEEYPNYVCSQYQDVFAFFVTGANPSGGNYTNYNMALIPGTTIPVSVNSVNSGTPGGSYTAGGCMSLGYSNYYVNNSALGGTTIAFGGFTTPLTAWCHVTPCQTYHLKMAVGDGFNGLFDSGVFLEANSFTSNGLNVNTSYSNSSLGSNAIEGCTNGIISFTTNTPVATPMTINYTVSGNATNGVDYTAIPNSITIPAGQDSVALIIHPLLDGITEGTETVIITVTTGCTSQTYTLNIIDNVNLSVNVGAGSTICSGNSANLSATANGGIGPFTYNWNPGGGTGSPVAVSPTVTTTYIVTVSDYCASSATNNVTITVNPIPTIITTATPAATCVGQSTALTCSGAATYIWMPGSLTGTPVNVSPTSTTTYSVTGTSASGCTSTSSVTVTVNPSPIVTATALPASLCLGQSTVLTGAGANTYSWMPGSLSGTTVNVTPATTTTYSVTGNSVAGCTSTGSVTVTINSNASIAVTALPATICLGQSTVLTGAGANTYSWMPGSLSGTTINVTPATTTTYSVTGTTSTGCSGTTSLTVSVNPIPIITASALPANICNGQSTSLTGAGANTYSWMPGSLSGTTVNVTPASTMTYSVTGTSAAGCTSTSSIVVTINASPNTTATSSDEHCGHADGTANANASGGLVPYSYIWSNNSTANNLTGLTGNNYSVTVTDNNGCSASSSVSLVNMAGPSAPWGTITQESCSSCNGSITIAPINGTLPYSYIWSNGQTSSLVNGLCNGLYGVTVTDANNCTASNQTNIINTPAPTAIGNMVNPAQCNQSNGEGTVIVNGGTGPFNYLWTNGQTSQNLTNVTGGNYVVGVSDANGCTTTAAVVINVVGSPNVILNSTEAICNKATGAAWAAVTGGSGIYSYQWSNGIQTDTINNLSPGNYCVTVSDGNCTTHSCTDVLNISGPIAEFSVSPTLMTTEDSQCFLIDQSVGASTWSWLFGDGTSGNLQNPSHNYQNTGTYEITLVITDANGCIDSTIHSVTVKGVYLFYIPNAFTPNGNGLNDFFAPTGLNIDLSNFEMFIYDRWGKQFYYTKDISKPWNGTLNNSGNKEELFLGVYVYKIIITDKIDGLKHEYVGKVTLVQ